MGQTRTGIERLLEAGAYRNSRIGLVTNPTGILTDGRANWRALLDAGYHLGAIFGPEHGFRGDAQDAVAVDDESFRGIRVYSLYGSREKPEKSMVGDLDCIFYDVQDVGCRYYTYVYTLAHMMDVCRETRTRVVVLDRPNPIRTDRTEGNPIDPEHESFLGAFGLAPRYGMTVGELAWYLKTHYFPDSDLDVVWMENYSPSAYFEETALPWPLPSPNLPRVDAALLYTGTCLIEGTNVSEGRGTTRPFELFGAPWIDADNFRDRLAGHELPGVACSSVRFTPSFSKYDGTPCEGVLIQVVDRDAVSPLLLGVTILSELASCYSEFAFKPLWEDPTRAFVDRLAGGPALREMVNAAESPASIYAALTERGREFEGRRQPARHY